MFKELLAHEYSHQTVLCDSARHIVTQVFQTMISSTKYIAPTDQDNPVKDGMIVQVNIFVLKHNPVVVTVMPSLFTIINRTLKGHVLHPGSVTRRIVQKSSEIVVETYGVGSGVVQGSFNVLNYTSPLALALPYRFSPSGRVNNTAAAQVWGGVDQLLKAALSGN